MTPEVDPLPSQAPSKNETQTEVQSPTKQSSNRPHLPENLPQPKLLQADADDLIDLDDDENPIIKPKDLQRERLIRRFSQHSQKPQNNHTTSKTPSAKPIEFQILEKVIRLRFPVIVG